MLRPCSVSLWIIALCTLPLNAEVPSLTHLFPSGGQRGTTVSVTCHGKFEWPAEVYASGVAVSVKEESGHVELAIPHDFSADRIWIRLYNSEGTSQAVPFLIGNVLEKSETEPNDSPPQSETLDQLPILINGVVKRADVDCYAVRVEAGQTLVAALDAHTRLGSPIDSVLQISLPTGIVVADNHDALGLDPRVHFTADKSGNYIVRVFGFSSQPNQDISLQGCNECVYRLTITTGPYATTAVPLAIQQSATPIAATPIAATPVVRVVGWNIPDQAEFNAVGCDGSTDFSCSEVENRGELRIPAESSIGFVHSPEFAGGARVRRVPFASSLNIVDQPDGFHFAISLPQAITSRLSRKAQVDRYRVSLKKGDPLIVTVESRTLGLSIDPLLRLLNPQGNRIVEVDDSAGTRDAVLAYNATEDGDFVIEVMDRYQAADDHAYYLLTAGLDQPDFELTAKADHIVVPAQGTAELSIQVTRRMHVGPISISAMGLPDGITAEPALSAAEGESASMVTLKISGNGTPFSGPVRWIGSVAQPVPIQRPVRTEPRLGVSLTEIWMTALASSVAPPP